MSKRKRKRTNKPQSELLKMFGGDHFAFFSFIYGNIRSGEAVKVLKGEIVIYQARIYRGRIIPIVL